MSYILISYCSEDREKAKAIAQALIKHGWSVWWDRNIPTGKSFEEVIEAEINKAKCVIVLWSKESVKSHRVREEANEGQNRNILIPILIEDTTIPFGFRRIQASNLIDWNNDILYEDFRLLINDIAALIDSSEHKEDVKGVVPVSTKVKEDESSEKPPTSKSKENANKDVPKRKKAVRKKGEKVESNPKSPLLSLRKIPSIISVTEAGDICVKLGFYEGLFNREGKGFTHEYELQNNGAVVFDKVAGLKWQQCGLDKSVRHKEAKSYVNKLNQENFAGYHDWRLPTLEEAMSLVEPKTSANGLYISSIFNETIKNIWTADYGESDFNVWVVSYDLGGLRHAGRGFFTSYYVRAVCG